MLTPSFHCFIIIILSFLSKTIEGRDGVATAPTNEVTAPSSVPALYVFGDSLVENGNNNNLKTPAKANYKPYGIDFFQGATGRFTNGKTIADSMSSALKLPFSPPYLRRNGSKSLTGYNYASAGSGIVPKSISRMGQCYSLDKQIDFFNETIQVVLKKQYPKSADLSRHLSRSILLFASGNNEYLNNYLHPRFPKSNFPPEKFARRLIHVLSDQMQRAYQLGGRKFIFVEIGPVGCMPFADKTDPTKGRCNELQNYIVDMFNQKLTALFTFLKSNLKGSQFVVVKANHLIYDVFSFPDKYGFKNCKDACCETTMNGLLTCKRGGSTCNKPNRRTNCFWDAFHPTEALNSLVVKKCLDGNSICTPMSLNQLAKA